MHNKQEPPNGKIMVQTNKNGYVPNPKSLSPELFPELFHDLLESMAENIHESWAYNKMQEGWTFGENHDRTKKKHPSLKPYSGLDESQKDYDRNTALATIAILINEGYITTK